MIYVVIGKPRHGKNTFAEMFAEHTGLKVGDCSDIIYEVLANIEDTTPEQLKEVPKEMIRSKLIKLGNMMIDANPCYFGEKLIERGCNIICGVRRLCELTILKDKHKCMTIWVQNDNAEILLDNTEVTRAHADIGIENNKDLQHLDSVALRLANMRKHL